MSRLIVTIMKDMIILVIVDYIVHKGSVDQQWIWTWPDHQSMSIDLQLTWPDHQSLWTDLTLALLIIDHHLTLLDLISMSIDLLET